jgi:hypothetical protein
MPVAAFANQYKASFAPRLVLFQLGAVAPQYAPSVCGAGGRLIMRAAQHYRVGRHAEYSHAVDECLSIQTSSGDLRCRHQGRIDFGCAIGPDFAICHIEFDGSSFRVVSICG